jgi:hypothetical protein
MFWSGASRAAPWLGRFDPPSLLRSQGAFFLGSTREHPSDLPRLVVFGAPGRDRGLQRQALERLWQAHQRIQHPRIAPVLDHGEADGVPYLTFSCDAVVDLGTLLREAKRIGLQPHHPQADGFILGLRQALQAAHGAPGGPFCLQDLAYGNVLFNRQGKHWLIGFGANVVTRDEHGQPLTGEPIFRPPEVTLGGGPSPSGDFVALILMMRSMLPVVSLAPAVGRALMGLSLAEDAELIRCLLWFERRVVAALPAQRASIEEAAEVSDRIRALLGVTPDPAGFERHIAAVMEQLLPLLPAQAEAPGKEPPRSDPGELKVGPDATWIETPQGARHLLGSRASLRRVLSALTDARLQRPGEALSVDALLQAGWPGERLAPDAGANRVYVLLSELRRMGLRGSLQRHDDGYRLDPALPVRLVDEGS